MRMEALSQLLDDIAVVPPGRFKYVIEGPVGKQSGKCHVLFSGGGERFLTRVPILGWNHLVPCSARPI